ncbi:MAG: hypothetical protein M0P61_03440 [Ignavibacteriaceae bacterium]|nr:hypothetical protein [Ignavibacteriaceae bacterium]
MRNLFILMLVIFVGCSTSYFDKEDEPQLVEIHLHYGHYDDVNTFEKSLVKDLIPGTVKISFWFTKREQEIILSKAERIGFFKFPDTVFAKPNVTISPDYGTQTLRIRVGDKDKTVVWFLPPDEVKFKYFVMLRELENLIIDIVESKPEYKVLPKRKGGYQ